MKTLKDHVYDNVNTNIDHVNVILTNWSLSVFPLIRHYKDNNEIIRELTSNYILSLLKPLGFDVNRPWLPLKSIEKKVSEDLKVSELRSAVSDRDKLVSSLRAEIARLQSQVQTLELELVNLSREKRSLFGHRK